MIQAQTSLSLAVLKYNGGGDYYANPTALPNLITYCNNTLGTKISEDVPYVEAGSKRSFPISVHPHDWTWKCSFFKRGS